MNIEVHVNGTQEEYEFWGTRRQTVVGEIVSLKRNVQVLMSSTCECNFI